MRITSTLFLAMLLFISSSSVGQNYDHFFTNQTMRMDYYHTGTAAIETISLDQFYEEGPWSGSKANLVDTLNLGKYLVKIYDLNTNQLVYSRGYSTVFGEWQTTDEALQGISRTMHETVRFPYPKNPLQVTISARDKKNIFREQFSTIIDPNSRFVNHEKKQFPFTISTIMQNGDPAHKVDLLILGDGYAQGDQDKFKKQVDHYCSLLFNYPPFKERKTDFNIWSIDVVSQESGIDNPRSGQWKDNQLGTTYNAFDLQRYVLTNENRLIRDIASMVPYDYIYILFNAASYGGGGIYNCFATCYTGKENTDPGWWSDYVFLHEFGHLFAGLADEYYTSSVAYKDFYPTTSEPYDPNITALLDKNKLKWADRVAKGTPIPTPWDKARYDSLSMSLQKFDRSSPLYPEFSRKTNQHMDNILKAIPQSRVGCYEGAGYIPQGLYRPSITCRMFVKADTDFCPVCQQAILRTIDFLIK